jgi:hypothetical protein
MELKLVGAGLIAVGILIIIFRKRLHRANRRRYEGKAIDEVPGMGSSATQVSTLVVAAAFIFIGVSEFFR